MLLLIWAFWMALNGRATAETALTGAVISALAMGFLCACCDWSWKKEKKAYYVSSMLLAYAGTVIWEIVKANRAMLPVVYSGKTEPVVRVMSEAAEHDRAAQAVDSVVRMLKQSGHALTEV